MAKSAKTSVETLLEQRRAVVEFGRTALKSDSLDEILTTACRLCAGALETELSKVMALEDNGRNLRVIAGVGWDDGVVGEEVVPALEKSSEGFALSRGEPAISHDVNDENRFDYPEFLTRHGVKALVNVVIPGGEADPPYGLLQVDSREEREFHEDDIEFLQSYANIVGAAIERLKKNDALRRATAQKDRALRELQHRVKNNLAVLSSLVRARNRRAEHPAVKQETASFLGLIQSLSELHDQLTASSNIDEIEIGGFLSALCSTLGSFASDGDSRCKVHTEVESVIVDSGTAIPLGIIANEFITNSLKYAMTDNLCTVHLSVKRDTSHVTITLRDEGEGMGDALEERSEKATGSGLNFIEALVEQVGAEKTWSHDEGTKLQIRIPLSPKKVAAMF